MAQIGSGVSNPDFYADKTRQIVNSLAAMSQAAERRRATKERKAQAELQNFFEFAGKNPEIADTWGADLVKRYGKDFPGVEQMVGVIRNKADVAKQVADSGKRWEDRWAEMQNAYEVAGEEISGMPDLAPSPLAGSSVSSAYPIPAPMVMPNVAKIEATKRYNEVDPGMIPAMALRGLPPSDQRAARLWAKSQGHELPELTPFDPLKHLSGPTRDVWLADKGRIGGDAATVAKTNGGLASTQAQKEARDFQTSEREKRFEQDLEKQKEYDRLVRERAEMQHRLDVRRNELYQAGAASSSGGGTKKEKKPVTHEMISGDVTALQQDYKARLQDATQGMLSTAKASAEKQFREENGPAPKPIPKTIAAQIAKEANARVNGGTLTEIEALEYANELTISYIQNTGGSFPLSPRKAISLAIEGGKSWIENQKGGDETVEEASPAAPAGGTVVTPGTLTTQSARARAEALIRERMKGAPEAEIEAAISEAHRRIMEAEFNEAYRRIAETER